MQYEDIDPTRIGNEIRDLRKQRGETVEELAMAINTSSSAVNMYECGFRIPRDEIKIRIAQHYSVPVESIFFKSNDTKRDERGA